MQQSPSWEPNTHFASQKTPHLVRNLKVHYHVHNSLPLVPILSQMPPVHSFPPCFPEIHSNIILHELMHSLILMWDLMFLWQWRFKSRSSGMWLQLKCIYLGYTLPYHGQIDISNKTEKYTKTIIMPLQIFGPTNLMPWKQIMNNKKTRY
jgi:hypothetical protein